MLYELGPMCNRDCKSSPSAGCAAQRKTESLRPQVTKGGKYIIYGTAITRGTGHDFQFYIYCAPAVSSKLLVGENARAQARDMLARLLSMSIGGLFKKWHKSLIFVEGSGAPCV